MLNRLSSTLLARFAALAMMLTVAFHAAQPVGAPVERVSGSAFSAATSDVAVAPDRREAVRKAIVLPAPAPGVDTSAHDLLPSARERPAPTYQIPPATGPPTWPSLSRGPAPQAPPLS